MLSTVCRRGKEMVPSVLQALQFYIFSQCRIVLQSYISCGINTWPLPKSKHWLLTNISLPVDSQIAGSLMQWVQLAADAPRCDTCHGNIWQTIWQLSNCVPQSEADWMTAARHGLCFFPVPRLKRVERITNKCPPLSSHYKPREGGGQGLRGGGGRKQNQVILLHVTEVWAKTKLQVNEMR